MRVIIVVPRETDSEVAAGATARSLDECGMDYLTSFDQEALQHALDPAVDASDGLLLVRAGVRFLKKPTTEDFVSPVTGENYLFSGHPEDWFPSLASPEPRACEQLIWLGRSAQVDLSQEGLSLGQILKTGYLHLRGYGQQFIWREPLIRTTTSLREFDALIATGIDEDSQRWGYLGIVNQAPTPAARPSTSSQARARALSRLVPRGELLRALAIRTRLVVLVNKEPYYRSRRWVGSVMLRVPVLRRFVQTG